MIIRNPHYVSDPQTFPTLFDVRETFFNITAILKATAFDHRPISLSIMNEVPPLRNMAVPAIMVAVPNNSQSL